MAAAVARAPRKPASPIVLAAPLVAGSAVAVALGVYARIHRPTLHALFGVKLSQTLELKAWLTLVVLLLTVYQLLTSLRMYRKIPIPKKVPRWMVPSHRLVGITAYLISLPVAFHCLWTLGFRPIGKIDRVVIHSIAGCLFYGAYAAKMIVVRQRGFPKWMIPAVGGITFATLVIVFLTSSTYYFTGNL